jgi:hypothetical protein
MRFLLTILALFIIASSLSGAETNPATGEAVAYIPVDVADAVRVLKKELTKEELADIEDPSRKDAADNNWFLGVGLRNSWGLWKNSRLAQWFVAHGVGAPEDMSSIILDALKADLNGRPFSLEKDLIDTKAGESQAADEAKQSEKDGLAAVAKIKGRMLGLKVVGKPAQEVTLPVRQNAQGLRVRYMAPFAGGYLITNKWYQDDDHIWTNPYFLDLARRSVRPIRIDGMKQIENAIVLAGTAWFEGPTASGESLVAFNGKTVRSIQPPPDSGALRFGQDGDKLLAVRPRAIYRWDGDRWTLVVRMHENLPIALVPPERYGNRIYLRDEGWGEDNKRLWWIDLDSGHIAKFDEACGLVTSEGPRWENVWSYAVEPDGRLWLAPGYSLVRWDPAGGYRVALMNGKAVFDGQLLESQDLDPSSLSKGWTLASNGAEKTQSFASVGLLLRADGALDVMGPNGLFRVAGDTITPLVAFKNTMQDIPKNATDDGLKDWALDPTHFLPLDHDAYLIGSHWEGLYLLAKDAGGVYRFTLLDGKIGRDITLREMGGG